jgi:preprotein translocase SecF subunit
MRWWPLVRIIPKKTNLKFVSFAGFAAFVSIAALAASFVSFATGGFRMNPVAVYESTPGSTMDKLGAIGAEAFNLGIDFRGGTMLEMEAPAEIDLERVRGVVSDMQLGDVQLQSVNDSSHALLRFEPPRVGNPAEIVDLVKAEIRTVVPEVRFTRTEVVGPKVSGELFVSGILAVAVAIGVMLIYIWFRFELQFGVGAVAGLFHDVILTLGLFSILRLEFTLTIVAALLTIIGYSMNDTVVVFDRIRENLQKFKKRSLGDLIDLSINETLTRTLMTGITALGALVGLAYLGGEALFGFAVAMVFGIVVGTYSSIYVAAPTLLLLGARRGRDKADAPKADAAAESARP